MTNKVADQRKAWVKPTVISVTPVSKTRGGFLNNNSAKPESFLYTPS